MISFSSMEPKDCLPSSRRQAFDRVTTSAARPITGKRWVLWRLQHHIRCLNCIRAPA